MGRVFETLSQPVNVTGVPELALLASITAEVRLNKIGTNTFQADVEDESGQIVTKLVFEPFGDGVRVLGYKDTNEQIDPELAAISVAEIIREKLK